MFPFKIKDLDDTHMFISCKPGIAKILQQKIDEWHDTNSYTTDEADEGIYNMG